ncbi:hypothetical protein H4R21_001422, partial [Coemansia helicoidea]
VILQRISSIQGRPLLPPVKAASSSVKPDPEKAAAAEPPHHKSTPEEQTTTEDLSVSSIINSVRKSRKAHSQQQLPATPTAALDSQSSTTDGRTAGESLAEEGADNIPYCLFDTHSMVNRLVENGFSREQATSIMTLAKVKVYEAMERLKDNMLTKSDLENDAYLFRAALQELRTETQMIRRNDQAILESQAAAISRDIESLAQRLIDEMDNLRSDIQIELNSHKHDSSHEMKSLDMELHTLASKYQVVMGEMKTDIEAIKLESIRKGMLAAVVTTAVLLVIIWSPELLDRFSLRRAGRARQPGRDASQGEDREVGSGARASPGQAVPASEAALDVAGAGVPPGQQQGQPPLSADGRAQAGAGKQGPGDAGPRFRDHSHLHIRYDPTISAAESQFGSMQQPTGESSGDSSGGYDDWFDAFFYSPQDIDRRRGRGRESASLVDSDPTFDAAYWRPAPRPETGGDGAPSPAEQAPEGGQQPDAAESRRPPSIPLNFSPSDGTERGGGDASS